MNKMLTVTVNVLIWDKHASSGGIAALAVCLIGGSFYQQAPPRDAPLKAEESQLRKLTSTTMDESEEELPEQDPVPHSKGGGRG